MRLNITFNYRIGKSSHSPKYSVDDKVSYDVDQPSTTFPVSKTNFHNLPENIPDVNNE